MGGGGAVAAEEVPGAAFSVLDLWQRPSSASWAREACDAGSSGARELPSFRTSGCPSGQFLWK